MDRLLKRENLDLQLTPYRVMATSLNAGMLEMVEDASTIADIIDEYKVQRPLFPLRSWSLLLLRRSRQLRCWCWYSAGIRG